MNSIVMCDDASEESEFLSALNASLEVLFRKLSKMNKQNAFIESYAMGEMFWPCYRRDQARALYTVSINFKRAIQPTPHQKLPQNSLLFVGLQSGTVPSPSSASETYSLRTKQEDVFYKINHFFVCQTVQFTLFVPCVIPVHEATSSNFAWFILIGLEMALLTLSLTDILIRGRQTNSEVIVSGVPSRREKKIGTPDRRLPVNLPGSQPLNEPLPNNLYGYACSREKSNVQ